MKKRLRQVVSVLVCLVMMLSLAACGLNRKQSTTTVNGVPRVYLTLPDDNVKFVRQDDKEVNVYDISELDRDSGIVVDIDPETTYQTIEGFGIALTESSVVNLYLLPEEERNKIMMMCFDEDEGVGLSFLRQPLGGSDFVEDYYSYDDVPGGETDFELEHFSIERDKEKMIPMVKQAISINPDIRLVGSVWSAPLWMKDKYEWTSENKAQIRLDCYNVFAQYIVKALQAWEEEGLPFYAITPSNEPTGIHDIPANYFTADNMTRLVNNYLRPAMTKAGLDTQLWCWDFSYWEDPVMSFLTPTVNSVDGVAFHAYSGEADLMGKIHEMYPDLSLYVTEAATSPMSAKGQLFRQVGRIDDAFRNHASGYFLWNLILDQDLGPQPEGAAIVSSGLFRLNTETMEVDPYMDFYVLAHYSKFMRPGAKMVESTDTGTETNGECRNTVVRNENGTITAVISNRTLDDVVYKLVIGNDVIEYKLPALGVATLTWDANIYEKEATK